jgi:hypothetical protein
MENTIYAVYSKDKDETRLVLVEEISGEGVVRMKLMGFGESLDAFRIAQYLQAYSGDPFEAIMMSATKFKKRFRGVSAVKDIFGK